MAASESPYDMPISAIRLEHLTKRYGDAVVVNDLDLNIPCGTIFGFLGPNGAGKSTTIRMMTGLTTPDSGDAWLMGKSIRRDPLAVKSLLGVVPDEMALVEYLTIEEHLDLIRSLFDVTEEEYRIRSEQLLTLLDLRGERGKLVRNCSYGMKKKLSLALALLPNPKIIILDEPFEGLDPVMCVIVKRALKRAGAQGTTVFLTTHLLHSVGDLIEGFGIIRDGILVKTGSMATLACEGQTLEDAYLQEFELPESARLEWLG